jgi:hypothetical protein
MEFFLDFLTAKACGEIKTTDTTKIIKIKIVDFKNVLKIVYLIYFLFVTYNQIIINLKVFSSIKNMIYEKD